MQPEGKMTKSVLDRIFDLLDKDTINRQTKNMGPILRIIFWVIVVIILVVGGIISGRIPLNKEGNLTVIIVAFTPLVLGLIAIIIICIKGDPYESEKEKIQDEVDTKDETQMKNWILKVEHNILKSTDLKRDIGKLLSDSEAELRIIKGIEPSQVRELTSDSYLNTINHFVNTKKLGDVSEVVKVIRTYKLGVSRIK